MCIHAQGCKYLGTELAYLPPSMWGKPHTRGTLSGFRRDFFRRFFHNSRRLPRTRGYHAVDTYVCILVPKSQPQTFPAHPLLGCARHSSPSAPDTLSRALRGTRAHWLAPRRNLGISSGSPLAPSPHPATICNLDRTTPACREVQNLQVCPCFLDVRTLFCHSPPVGGLGRADLCSFSLAPLGGDASTLHIGGELPLTPRVTPPYPAFQTFTMYSVSAVFNKR
jgi:hypothetical protein